MVCYIIAYFVVKIKLSHDFIRNSFLLTRTVIYLIVNTTMFEMFSAWKEKAERYKNGEITKEEYDCWRYNYPKYDETSGYVKAPSQGLSDMSTELLKSENRK